jgi:ectoine hydroxylase-related dioxygenase (phytanoyl-CoA dioxygenase family)
MIQAKDVQFYKDNGYLLVKNIFSTDEVEEMREAVNGIIYRSLGTKYEKNTAWQGDFLPAYELKKLVLRGTHDIHYHDSAFTRAIVHPRMVEILKQIIGPNVQLHHSKMLVKPPENGAAFPMHQDYPYFPHTNHSMLAASVHLDDADTDNGCIHVIPGSHKQGALPHVGKFYLNHIQYPIEDGLPCPAQAGDVLFFNYLTIHGSKPNRSDRVRRNVLFQYRDAFDPPTEKRHINWGQGLMVCGKNEAYHEFKEELQKDKAL